MKTVRQWHLTPAHPYTLSIAADARLSRTSYADDQVWDILVGEGDAPAVTLQTKYGGRAGLVSLVPMWTHEGHNFYQALSYHQAPTIRHFLPDTVVLEAMPLADVTAEMTFRVMESCVVAGMVKLENKSHNILKLRLELFGHVGIEGKEQKLSVVNLEQGGNALYFGTIANLHPVVLMPGGTMQMETMTPRLGVDITLTPGGTTILRFLHVALPSLRQSLLYAEKWLAQDWTLFVAHSEQAAHAIPEIETGNDDWDAVLAASYQVLLQSFLKPAGHFPHGTFVASRTSSDGYSKKGDGSDHPRSWNGQDPLLAYLATAGIANIAPELAKGIVLNYLAVQNKQTGAIDYKPGAAGQRHEMLCLPILARMAWQVYEQTQDAAFLKTVFPGLIKFLDCWLSAAYDRDGDNFPEWQDDRQTGYAAFPVFAPAQIWGQGAAINTVESPDLLAYLLSEITVLHQMAEQLQEKTALKNLKTQQSKLNDYLTALWHTTHYVYRDRDTHVTQVVQLLLRDGVGDEEHIIGTQHDPAARLIVRVSGGVTHVPRITLTIEGISEAGSKISEILETKDFVWLNRQGVATTQRVYAQVHRMKCEGLSRVYRLNLQTVDTTALDINALLPLILPNLPAEQAKSLIKLVTDKTHFWRPNGVTMVSAQDARFDASNARGGGGLWLYWAALLAEGLLQHGEHKKALELIKNILTLQTTILTQEKGFKQFYNSDLPSGYGEHNHLGGIFPVYLLARLFGINIIAADRVQVGGAFAWGKTVSIKQHGITVKRTTKKISIRFPSGHKVELDGNAEWQLITDPKPQASTMMSPPALPDLPGSISDATPAVPKRVIIQVEMDD